MQRRYEAFEKRRCMDILKTSQWANDVILTFYLCQNKVTVRFDVFLMSN